MWFSFPFELALVVAVHSFCLLAHAHFPAHHNHIGHWRLAGRDGSATATATSNVLQTATPCVGPGCVGAYPTTANLPCADINGTTIVSGKENTTWTVLCDTDFFAQDIYPFFLTTTFDECLQHCDQYNSENNGGCAGFVFAPDRIRFENSCYLKSSVNDVVYPSTIHLIGATMVPLASPATVVPAAQPTVKADPAVPTLPASTGVIVVSVTASKELGVSENDPATQYVVHPHAVPQKLAIVSIKPGVNLDLVTKYPLADDTGSWTSFTAPLQLEFANMTLKPRMSRDGGRGGNINGTHVFMFCDTATFGTEETVMGYMNGFVSSSAAIADSVAPHEISHLVLKDTVGQWQDDVGRLRGWIQMTTGEEAFNIEISGNGLRYAVWPDSSFIPYNSTHALMYAPVVYVEVDMKTQAAQFQTLGNTMVLIYIDPEFGPHADRTQNLMFTEPEVEWGSLAGLRAWGASGNGTMDGTIYLFGAVEKGILVSKAAPSSIEDRSAYTYWNGTEWSSEMPTRDSTAYLIEQPVMSFDIFYAPLFETFIMVYLTPDADNTFYYRSLQVDHANPVIPPYMPGGDDNYCERILHEPWSEPQVLYKPQAPAIGYIYAGGAHMGYFGGYDITQGGDYILITWTQHTEKDPNDPASGYAHKAAWVRFERV